MVVSKPTKLTQNSIQGSSSHLTNFKKFKRVSISICHKTYTYMYFLIRSLVQYVLIFFKFKCQKYYFLESTSHAYSKHNSLGAHLKPTQVIYYIFYIKIGLFFFLSYTYSFVTRFMVLLFFVFNTNMCTVFYTNLV